MIFVQSGNDLRGREKPLGRQDSRGRGERASFPASRESDNPVLEGINFRVRLPPNDESAEVSLLSPSGLPRSPQSHPTHHAPGPQRQGEDSARLQFVSRPGAALDGRTSTLRRSELTSNLLSATSNLTVTFKQQSGLAASE